MLVRICVDCLRKAPFYPAAGSSTSWLATAFAAGQVEPGWTSTNPLILHARTSASFPADAAKCARHGLMFVRIGIDCLFQVLLSPLLQGRPRVPSCLLPPCRGRLTPCSKIPRARGRLTPCSKIPRARPRDRVRGRR
jgi:hypothetical protein